MATISEHPGSESSDLPHSLSPRFFVALSRVVVQGEAAGI